MAWATFFHVNLLVKDHIGIGLARGDIPEIEFSFPLHAEIEQI